MKSIPISREAQIEAGIIPKEPPEEGDNTNMTDGTEEEKMDVDKEKETMEAEEEKKDEKEKEEEEEVYVKFENPLSYLIKAVAIQNPKQFSLPPEMMKHEPLPGKWKMAHSVWGKSVLDCSIYWKEGSSLHWKIYVKVEGGGGGSKEPKAVLSLSLRRWWSMNPCQVRGRWPTIYEENLF